MKYILKNKDIDVLEFEVEIKEINIDLFKRKEFTHDISNVNVFNKSLIPINMDRNKNINDSLKEWIIRRKVPKNRKHIEKIVATFSQNNNSHEINNKQKSLMDYIDVCLGLSLNDSYWIISKKENLKWSDYNLYNNKFDKALELVALEGISHKVKGLVTSPEYTTNGMLKKCWHRENNTIYLYKGSTHPYANGGREAYSEYYMAQIAKTMNFNHISYDLIEFHNQLVSACKIFTSENEGYMPIYYFLKDKNMDNIDSIAEIYGRESFQDLMLFDAFICNTDRHLGNFGMIINNNTNKILRPAPIFDNGFSMMNFLMESELDDVDKYTSLQKSYFGYDFNEQLKLVVQPRHIESLEKLLHFTFKRHHKFNLDEKWFKPLESHIQNKANIAIKLAREKEITQKEAEYQEADDEKIENFFNSLKKPKMRYRKK